MLKHPVNHVVEAARHLACCINKFSATFTSRRFGLFLLLMKEKQTFIFFEIVQDSLF
jgi:hypothetical protein